MQNNATFAHQFLHVSNFVIHVGENQQNIIQPKWILWNANERKWMLDPTSSSESTQDYSLF